MSIEFHTNVETFLCRMQISHKFHRMNLSLVVSLQDSNLSPAVKSTVHLLQLKWHCYYSLPSYFKFNATKLQLFGFLMKLRIGSFAIVLIFHCIPFTSAYKITQRGWPQRLEFLNKVFNQFSKGALFWTLFGTFLGLRMDGITLFHLLWLVFNQEHRSRTRRRLV